MFDFLKKNKGEVPPDVGQEDAVGKKGAKSKGNVGNDGGSTDAEEEIEEVGEEGLTSESEEEIENDSSDKPVGRDYGVEEEEESPKKKSARGVKKSGRAGSAGFGIGGVSEEKLNLELEKIRSRMEAMASLIQGYTERLSMMSQQIGEVRAMNLATEKSIAKLSTEASKAADIVKEVRPERLRVEYQKMDLKAQELFERIEANKQFADSVLEELKDVKRKMRNFLGTEELLKLNDDVKKDLIETQQLAARARLHADKTEQLFSEMRRGLAEAAKMNAQVATLDSSYSGIKKEVERLKIDFSKIVNQDDVASFKNNVNSKLVGVDEAFSSFERIKDENQRLTTLIERILAITQKNKEDIGNVGLAVGEDSVKRVSDYDNRLDSVLSILDSLAEQVAELRKGGGVKVLRGNAGSKKISTKVSRSNREELVEDEEGSAEGKSDKIGNMEEEVGGAAESVGVRAVPEEEGKTGLRAKIEKAFGLNKESLFSKNKDEGLPAVEGSEKFEDEVEGKKEIKESGSKAKGKSYGEELMEEDLEEVGEKKEEVSGEELMEEEASEDKPIEEKIVKKAPVRKVVKDVGRKAVKVSAKQEAAKKKVEQMKKKILGGSKLDDESEAIKSAVGGDKLLEHLTIEPVVGNKISRKKLSLKELEKKIDEVSPETKKLAGKKVKRAGRNEKTTIKRAEKKGRRIAGIKYGRKNKADKKEYKKTKGSGGKRKDKMKKKRR